MKTTLAIVLLVTFYTGSATIARAVCVGASVNSFGARGDGVTESHHDSAPIPTSPMTAYATSASSKWTEPQK